MPSAPTAENCFYDNCLTFGFYLGVKNHRLCLHLRRNAVKCSITRNNPYPFCALCWDILLPRTMDEL